VEKHLHIKEGGVTADGKFSIEKNIRCLGRCADAPVVTINDKFYGRATVDGIIGAIDELK
jgi:NADH:ubiquinone oxidoreductase subunit E